MSPIMEIDYKKDAQGEKWKVKIGSNERSSIKERKEKAKDNHKANPILPNRLLQKTMEILLTEPLKTIVRIASILITAILIGYIWP